MWDLNGAAQSPTNVTSERCETCGTIQYLPSKEEEQKYGGFVEGYGGTRWHSWLGHCATSRKVAGSIPDGAIGILH